MRKLENKYWMNLFINIWQWMDYKTHAKLSESRPITPGGLYLRLEWSTLDKVISIIDTISVSENNFHSCVGVHWQYQRLLKYIQLSHIVIFGLTLIVVALNYKAINDNTHPNRLIPSLFGISRSFSCHKTRSFLGTQRFHRLKPAREAMDWVKPLTQHRFHKTIKNDFIKLVKQIQRTILYSIPFEEFE